MDVSARSKRARVCSGCVVLCACQTSFPSSPVCDSRPLAPAFSLSLPLSRPPGASHKADSVLVEGAAGCSCSDVVGGAVVPPAAAAAAAAATAVAPSEDCSARMQRI